MLAWLRVAGGNSVLPPWVSLSFPRVREAIAMLRDRPCADPACAWCREQHDLEVLLPRYFPGITRFRAAPATADGHSLQRVIVENGFAGRSTLAILPTGGGKSLCFQSREGISNSASPSSTTVEPTEHTVEKTARRFSVFNSLTVTRATTVSPILTGALNFSVCDR